MVLLPAVRHGLLFAMVLWLQLAAAQPLPPLNKPTVPAYEQTWDMQRSTVIMPCNRSGPLDPEFFGQFGIVDVDWSNEKNTWANQHPMNSSGLMLEQALSIRKRSKIGAKGLGKTKVWAYRNLVKALPWITTVRLKLEDPQYSGWFLSFDAAKLASNSTVEKPCDLNRPDPTAMCSTMYHDQRETPEHRAHPDPAGMQCEGVCDCGSVIPCGEYVFDHRNVSLRKWLLEEYIGGPEGIGSDAIDGIFIDDSWTKAGPSEIETHCVADVGMSPADVTQMIGAWKENMAAVQQYIIQQGAMNWQLFLNDGTLQGPPFTQGNTPAAVASCENYFRTVACVDNSTLEHLPLLYGVERNHDYPPFKYVVSFEQSHAAFMLARGPYAWFGYSWVSCAGDCFGDPPQCPGRGQPGDAPWNQTFPDFLKKDYGVPLGRCKETMAGSGTFVREWSKSKVTLNCKTWSSSITIKSDDDGSSSGSAGGPSQAIQ